MRPLPRCAASGPTLPARSAGARFSLIPIRRRKASPTCRFSKRNSAGAAGRPWGVDYAFEKIEVRANTLQAHRLIHWAQQRGDAAGLVERLFVAQFQRGERIGDLALLVKVAVECGYPGEEVERYLASGADSDEVRATEHRFRAMGISMVPTFIIEGRQVVVGAEDPVVLAAAICKSMA